VLDTTLCDKVFQIVECDVEREGERERVFSATYIHDEDKLSKSV
jgi:hypothetical protein